MAPGPGSAGGPLRPALAALAQGIEAEESATLQALRQCIQAWMGFSLNDPPSPQTLSFPAVH